MTYQQIDTKYVRADSLTVVFMSAKQPRHESSTEIELPADVVDEIAAELTRGDHERDRVTDDVARDLAFDRVDHSFRFVDEDGEALVDVLDRRV